MRSSRGATLRRACSDREIFRFQFGTNPEVAFICASLTVNGFGVRVAQNRGTTVEVFRNVTEAVTSLGWWPDPEEAGGASFQVLLIHLQLLTCRKTFPRI